MSDSTQEKIREKARELPEPLKVPLRVAFHGLANVYGSLRHLIGRPWCHLLICGYPRSGTSLLYNMLAATLPNYQFTPFEKRAQPLLTRAGNIASKTPMDVFEVEHMLQKNPWKKRLLLVVPLRDLRDILTSRHPMLPEEYFIGYDHSWWPTRQNTWVYDAPGISAIAEQISHLSHLDEVSLLQFRYEDLLADANSIQQQLVDRFGLEFSSTFADFHKNPERLAYRYEGKHSPRDSSLVREHKAVDRDRAGKWQSPEHRGRIIKQFTDFPQLFDLLIQMGYEKDRSWFSDYQRMQ